MHSFRRGAPLDLAQYTAPAIEDRTGPPLSQGFLFTMIATVASEHCSPEILDALSRVDPDAWYHGQLLESILTHFEEKDPALVPHIGRNIYFFMRTQLLAQGITSPRAVLEGIPAIWHQVTRGDGGEWTAIVGPRRARLEACQPYNCHFEEGTVRGLVEALEARNVRIDHGPCMRDGAPGCVFEVRWEE
ncbi:MAG: hypothetical protein ABJE95_06795 [Byssovorax sp.]